MRSKAVWFRLLVFPTLALLLPTESFAASVILNWVDTSTNETGFKIERMPAGGSYSLLATVGSNVQSYTDSSVVAGASYCYRVSAYNSYGTSAPSNAACAQVPAATSSGGSSDGSGSSGSSGGSSSGGGTVTATQSYIGGKWKNYKISLWLKPQDKGDIGFMFRYLDSENYYRFVWDADSDRFRLELRAGGALKVLATRNANLKAGKFYPVQVSANGSQITAFLDGRELISLSDPTLSEGQVALYTSSSPNAAFDNVVVTDLQTGAVLLQDDFRSSPLSGWTIIDEAPNGPSSWYVSNQTLVQKSEIGASAGGDSFGTFALYTRGSWNDYRFSVTMRSMDDDTIGVMFRFKDDLNYYRFSWDNQEHFRRLEKRVNGKFTTLAEDTASYTIGRNYQLAIVAQGTRLQVLVDGQLVFSVTDGSLNGGTVALYSRWNTGAAFDNVLVEDLKTGTLLLWDDFNDSDATGWTIIDDEGVSGGPSNWFVSSGTFFQNTNIGSNTTGKLGTFALY